MRKCNFCSEKIIDTSQRQHKIYCNYNCKQRFYSNLKRVNICLCGCSQLCKGKYKMGHWVIAKPNKNPFVQYNKKIKQNINLNPHWKGGKIEIDGYIFIYTPNHPNKKYGNYYYEHRLKMEKKLKRFLKENEIIHHIDGNKKNNKLSNLLLTNPCNHARIHYQNTKRNSYGRFLPSNASELVNAQ